MKKLLIIALLVVGCGIFNTEYTCTLWYYQHLDSTYTISGGTMTVSDADSEEDAEDKCEEQFPDYAYCTCRVE